MMKSREKVSIRQAMTAAEIRAGRLISDTCRLAGANWVGMVLLTICEGLLLKMLPSNIYG